MNGAALIHPKCLILRKLLRGVRAAQWFNLKGNLVVFWEKKKTPRKICCCFEKYLLESVRCRKTEPKNEGGFI